MKFFLLPINLCLFGLSGFLNAQELLPKSCGTDHVIEELFISQPGLREVYNRQFEELSARARVFGRNLTVNEVIEIPVVVHVLEDGNSTYYKTDQQILDWINRANAVLDGSANDILDQFNGGAQIPVRLVLARRTPQNTLTNGIIRYNLSNIPAYVNNGVNYYDSTGVDFHELTLDKQWDNSSYYNVYINNKFDGNDGYRGGLMGFAYFPGSSRDYSYMVTANLNSSDTTFAHEMMHAFGIKHVFDGGDSEGATCGSVVNDGIDDTQRTKSLLSTWPVPTNNDFNECAQENYDGVQHNMMNYGYALNRFTNGQRNLAYQTIEVLRGSLKTSLGALPPSTNMQQVLPSNCIPQQITGVGGLPPNSSYKIGIQQFNFGTINNRSSLHSGPTPVFYTDYTLNNNINTAFIAEVAKGDTYPITLGTSSMSSVKYTAFIDYNNNGTFEESERVINLTLAAGSDWNTLNTATGNITIPETAVTNTPLRMRVIGDSNSSLASMGACDDRYLGEVEDYTVIVKDIEGCDGISDNIIALTSTGASVGVGSSFNLSASGIMYSSSITIQWQKSTDGINWQNIQGATNINYTGTVSGNIGDTNYYRLKATCDGNDFYSSIVSHRVVLQYCLASSADTSFEFIDKVNFGEINHVSSASSQGYEDFTHIKTDVSKGNTYALTVDSSVNSYSSDQVLVWIDFNQNGSFEDTEKVFTSSVSGSPWTGSVQIPSTALLGETRMRVRLYDTAEAGNNTACGVSGYGEVEDYTINITSGNETIWENQAWSNGIPNETKEAIIKDHLVVTSGEIVAKKLTIEAGSLTLNEGTVLRLEDELINQLTADKVVFENGAYLLQNNSTAVNIGNVTYKRNSTPIYRLETLMWSSPVDGQKIGEISPETLANRFTRYNENANNWEIININNDFVKGEMIAFRSPNTFANYTSPNIPGRIFTGEFVGTPINGDINVSTTVRNSSQGFNGLGNPYASPILLDAFFNAPANVPANIEALYFWTREHKIVDGQYQNGAGSNWITYNRLGWSNGSNLSTLNAAQGFIAKVQNAGNLYFSNNMRTVSTNNVSNRASDISKYWLELTKENETVNSILVGYIDGSTPDYDVNFDAKPMQLGEGIYSLIGQDKFLIQGRGTQVELNDVVPLTLITSTAGEYQIKLNNPQGDFTSQIIYLIDKSANRTINLSEEVNYQFTTGAGEFTDRFEIVYQDRILNTSDLLQQEISIYTQNKEVKIKSKESIRTVDIFDFEGRLIQSNSKIDAKVFSTTIFKQQLVIVKVTLANGKVITKKVML